MTTATDETTEIAARRAQVAGFLRDGLSQRDIARRLGVSKDTVYRDVQIVSRAAATAADQPGTPFRVPRIIAIAEGATSPPPPKSPAPATPTVPSLAVPLTPQLLADLADLTRTGASPEAALRHAIATVASTYRTAWAAGLYPPTATPVVAKYQFVPYQPTVPQTLPSPANRRQS
ncbi:helix-turn-helix domain-containing protein [Streptomyces sp. NPDC093249]|uniref:helix-turn-helix domain-containing protein n=1 Tax=unclassified Streptomyces TaxID=2593676 RepID=UPI003825385D